MYYTFSNEEIEALPEEVRNALSLEVYHPPSLEELLEPFILFLKVGTECNVRDVQYYLWKETGEMFDPTKVRPVLQMFKRTEYLQKRRIAEGLIYTRV